MSEHESLIDALRDLVWEASSSPEIRSTTAFLVGMDLMDVDFRREVYAEIRRDEAE